MRRRWAARHASSRSGGSGHGFFSGVGFCSAFVEDRLVGQRSERGHEDRALGGFEHARVAVVDRRVEEHTRPRPALPAVVGLHQLHAPERADVGLAAAGIGQQQSAAATASQGRPAVVQVGLAADHLGFPHDRSPRGSRGARHNEHHGGGGPRGTQPLPSVPVGHGDLLQHDRIAQCIPESAAGNRVPKRALPECGMESRTSQAGTSLPELREEACRREWRPTCRRRRGCRGRRCSGGPPACPVPRAGRRGRH